MTWQRLESTHIASDPTRALMARIADPLWFLGRQWQVGELTGHDGGRAITVSATSRHLPLQRVGAGLSDKPLGEATALDGQPLEAIVEAEMAPASGVDLSRRARLGASLLRRLRSAKAATSFISQISNDYAFTEDDLSAEMDELTRARLENGIDAQTIATALQFNWLRPTGRAEAVCEQWLAVVASQVAAASDDELDAWNSERIEYQYHVTAASGAAEVHLNVDEYHGGSADWFVGSVQPGPKFASRLKKVNGVEHTMVANPIRFAGMPALRWWEIEPDSVAVAYGHQTETDLARGIVSAFATTFGSDWLLLPVPAARGEFVDIGSVSIIDSFGEKVDIDPMASLDEKVTGSAHGGRPWRFMEMSGDTGPGEGRAPLVFLAPTASGIADGPVLEHVRYARDEMSNMAWAIEAVHMSETGRPVNRGEKQPPVVLTNSGATSTDDDESVEEALMHWRFDAEVAEHWIPLVAVRRQNSSARWFQRGRMAAPPDAPDGWGRARGRLLRPNNRVLLREEEIPRSGIDVTRRHRMARTSSGQPVTWLARRKRLGKVDAAGVWLPDQITFRDRSDDRDRSV